VWKTLIVVLAACKHGSLLVNPMTLVPAAIAPFTSSSICPRQPRMEKPAIAQVCAVVAVFVAWFAAVAAPVGSGREAADMGWVVVPVGSVRTGLVPVAISVPALLVSTCAGQTFVVKQVKAKMTVPAPCV